MGPSHTRKPGTRLHTVLDAINPRFQRWSRYIVFLVLLLLCLILAPTVQPATIADYADVHAHPSGPPRPLPHFDHIVVLIEENHSYSAITTATDTPYLHTLMRQGAVFTQSYAITHPSTPNYLALFAGTTYGLASDACPQTLTGPNLATELASHHLTFTAYSEDLPSPGFAGCRSGAVPKHPIVPLYARKHDPWADFASVPASVNQPLRSLPTDFTALPTVAFVIPSQQDNMHTGSPATADAWLQTHLSAYVTWAQHHNSLLIITCDESDHLSSTNHIFTLFVGAHIQPGDYDESIDHYDVLRTIEAIYGLPYLNATASASTIADVWQP